LSGAGAVHHINTSVSRRSKRYSYAITFSRREHFGWSFIGFAVTRGTDVAVMLCCDTL
jgi:hypothetical protein